MVGACRSPYTEMARVFKPWTLGHMCLPPAATRASQCSATGQHFSGHRVRISWVYKKLHCNLYAKNREAIEPALMFIADKESMISQQVREGVCERLWG